MLKGTLLQNILIVKSGHIGTMNSLNIGGWKKLFKHLPDNLILATFLVPETMSLLNGWSKVCIAPFHMRSKVCIAPFYVWSQVC